jgi:hypothetical protein
MAQYYAEEDDSYGTNSLKANGQNKVNIMVPYQFTDKPAIEEISSHPWAVAFPTLYISTIGQEENFGGPVTVEYSEKDRTRYLLYAEADTYTSEVTGAGYVAPNIPKAPFTDVKIEMGDSRNDVENIEEYCREAYKAGLHPTGKLLLPGKEAGKYQLDLWLANVVVLRSAGVLLENIEVTDICTNCNPDYLFSHRASGGKRGNLGAFLVMK